MKFSLVVYIEHERLNMPYATKAGSLWTLAANVIYQRYAPAFDRWPNVNWIGLMKCVAYSMMGTRNTQWATDLRAHLAQKLGEKKRIEKCQNVLIPEKCDVLNNIS